MPTRDIHRSDPHLLSKLMGLEPEAAVWQTEELGAIFQHQLRTPLQLDLGVDANRTFGDLLREPQPPVELLKHVKDFGKAHRNDPASPLPHDIATVLYFASIAAALARSGQRITQLDDVSLRAGIEWAVAQPWIDEATRALLDQGLKHVRKSG